MKNIILEANLTSNQKNIIMNIRDNLIKEKIASPYDAAFLTSLYADLIVKDLITPEGFSSNLNSQVFFEQNWTNLSEKELLTKLNDPRTFGTTKNNLVSEDRTTLLIAFRDMMEYMVLTNPSLYKDFNIINDHNGIAVINQKVAGDTEQEENKHTYLIPKDIKITNVGFMEYPNKAEIQQERIQKILSSGKPEAAKVAAYDENFVTFRFKGPNDAIDGLNNFYRRFFLEDFKDSNFEEFIDYQGDKILGERFLNAMSPTWCTASSSARSSTRNYIESEDDFFLYTFNYNPAKEILKYILIKGINPYSRRDLEPFITEAFRTDGNKKYYHNLLNNPYRGISKPYLNPRPSYSYEDVMSADSVTKTSIFYPFRVDERTMTLEGYIGKNPREIIELEVPMGIKGIGSRAFYNLDSLETIVLPATVTRIAVRAFSHNPNLKYIQVTHRLSVISDGAFDLPEEQLKELYIGVFEKHNGEIVVSRPDGLRYMCRRLAKAQGLDIAEDGLFNSKTIKNKPNIARANIPYEMVSQDEARWDIQSGKGFIVKNGTLEYVSEQHRERLEVPTGVVNLTPLKEYIDRLTQLTYTFSQDHKATHIEIPFNLTALNLQENIPEHFDLGTSYRLKLSRPSALKVLNTPVRLLPLLFREDISTADQINTLQYLILKTEQINIYDAPFVSFRSPGRETIESLPLDKFFFKGLIVEDPREFYEFLKDSNSLEVIRNKKNRWKLYKGTSINQTDGQLDIDKFLKGDFSMIPTTQQEARTYLVESAYRSGSIESYVQLVKELKHISLVNLNQFKEIIDRLVLTKDTQFDYKNVSLEVSYVELPIVRDSDIKVKLVVLENQLGVILITPENVSETYEELKENPDSLVEVNKNFSLYAEVIGLDSTDPELIDSIKKAYLAAGDYAGAFSVPQPKPEAPEKSQSTSTEEFDDFIVDSDFDTTDFTDLTPETFSTEELEANFESFSKFKITTNSLAQLTRKLKVESAQIIKDNIRTFKVNNVIIVEVNNKNIYKLLEATPGIAKTILSNFGEDLKQFEGIQIIDSYVNNGKRYFIIAEQASNNYWYAKTDNLLEAKIKGSKIVPKSKNIIVLEQSNIRLQERRVVPSLIQDTLVFTKGERYK